SPRDSPPVVGQPDRLEDLPRSVALRRLCHLRVGALLTYRERRRTETSPIAGGIQAGPAQQEPGGAYHRVGRTQMAGRAPLDVSEPRGLRRYRLQESMLGVAYAAVPDETAGSDGSFRAARRRGGL